jgi:hypothetical protein
VVMLFEPGRARLLPLESGSEVRAGSVLGRAGSLEETRLS